MRVKLACATALALCIPVMAEANIAVTFGSRDGGAQAFDAIVASGGATPSNLSLGAFNFGQAILLPGGITVTRNDGSFLTDRGIYTGFHKDFHTGVEQTTGHTIDISPYRGVNGPKDSGVTFSFANPVNAFGFEVGDWGTCCQPSALYISFDDGAPIQVGNSLSFGDVFKTNDESIVFVGALDDSGSFSKVQFWGDGFGEYLVIGGTLRSANLDFGTIGDGSSFTSPLTPISVDTNTGAFNFGFVVQPNVPVVIDPDIAVGYEYQITSGPSDAFIASVAWENLGDADGYDIYTLTGDLIVADFMPDVLNKLIFADYGFTDLTGFRVEDIDPDLKLDPDDILAFKTELTFDGYQGAASFGVSQTPLTINVPGVPEPATWFMMIGGFALVGGAMRRRRQPTLAFA